MVTRRASGSIAVIVSRRTRTPGLGDVAIGQPHRVGRRAPEHHVELREPEHERVALVDQRHLELAAERLRQHGAQLQPAEPRAENEYARAHRATISGLAGSCPAASPGAGMPFALGSRSAGSDRSGNASDRPRPPPRPRVAARRLLRGRGRRAGCNCGCTSARGAREEHGEPMAFPRPRATYVTALIVLTAAAWPPALAARGSANIAALQVALRARGCTRVRWTELKGRAPRWPFAAFSGARLGRRRDRRSTDAARARAPRAPGPGLTGRGPRRPRLGRRRASVPVGLARLSFPGH